MAQKTGILSDKEFHKNCLSFKAYPVGYANSDFERLFRNPMLDGVKTPKYQQSAAKPMSADVRAVNASNAIKGNRFETARMLLEQYKNEVQAWSPAKVNIRSPEADYQDLLDFLEREDPGSSMNPFGPAMRFSGLKEYAEALRPMYEARVQAANVAQRNVSALSRGAQITRQSISTQASISGLNDYLTMFYQLPTKEQQNKAANDIYRTIGAQGVDLRTYGVSSTKMTTGTVQERQQELTRMIQAANASNVILDYAQFLSPLSTITRAVSGGGSSSSDISTEVGTGSLISQAMTQQGIAQTQTTTTTPEVEKK